MKQYIIPFYGLKAGKHKFHFNIDKKFLEHFNFPELEELSAELDFSIDKQTALFTLNFEINGNIKTTCDRCGDNLCLPIYSREELFVKFLGDENEKIVVIPPNATEIDISQYIYEFITFAIPLKKIHPEGKCNRESLKRLKEIEAQSEKQEKMDPRWEQLLKISLS